MFAPGTEPKLVVEKGPSLKINKGINPEIVRSPVIEPPPLFWEVYNEKNEDSFSFWVHKG
jgi:hypothetical protein